MNWVDCILDVPADLATATRSFWAGVLGWKIGEPWSDHPEFTSLQPPDGASFVHVQVIEGSPRVHVDLTVSDIEAEAHRLVGLGATVGARTSDWQVMASPGGFPFCLIGGPERKPVPEPTQWADGHASRLVQICIDSPADMQEIEFRFWPPATRWTSTKSDRPEFAGRSYPPDGPVRFLYQRLGRDDEGGGTRAHLDLATDDMEAEVARVVELGAVRIGPGDGWYALRDPAGMAFCVTSSSPY